MCHAVLQRLFHHITEQHKLRVYQNRVTEDEYICSSEGGSDIYYNCKALPKFNLTKRYTGECWERDS